jgi:hypothetical protein
MDVLGALVEDQETDFVPELTRNRATGVKTP